MSRNILLKATVFLTLLLITQLSFAQDRVITGKVSDARNASGIAGVTIIPKGAAGGTQTGSDGSYRIMVSPTTTVLVFSSVGFNTQEVSIDGRSVIDVSLSVNTSTLGDVVIIGYGTARKKDLTGSISSISAKDFVKGPTTSPEQLIMGKVPGVQITPGSGMPGAGARIRIRAGTSLNASNDPLIVIDGVPLDNGGISGASSALALINPNDIDNITVLKDASAAAIYGNRAANGVIIITTKKGSAGRVQVDFNTVNSISKITDKVDVLSPDEFRALVQAKGNASEKAMLGTANTDWQDLIYQQAFTTDNNIALRGGIKKLPYRLSLGYLNQDGVLKRSNLNRYSVGLNLSPKFLDNHLSVNLNTKYSHSKNFFANQGAIGAAVFFDPTKPVNSGKTEYGGYYEWLSSGTTLNGLAPKNPVGLLNQRDDQSDVDRFIGNLQLDYKFHFLPDLHANLNVGGDRSHGTGTIYVPATAASDFSRTSLTGSPAPGRYNQYDQTKTNKLLEFYFNYNKEISSIRSRIDAVAGYSYQDWKTESKAFADLAANKTDTVGRPGTPGYSQNTLLSVYGRVNYSLMNRYLLTFTMRRDGSSRFRKENRWGNFPSAAFAWNAKEESFFKNSRAISTFKVRLGWGITGQQDGIPDYGYQPVFFYGFNDAASYQFGNSYVLVARPQAYDENLRWEQTESKNVGIDLGFLSNRLTLSMDYYKRKTKDLLASVPAPAGTNFSNVITTNIGSTESNGFELGFTAIPVSSKNFTLELGYNMTYIMKYEITKLQLVNDPSYLGADVGSIGINGTIQKNSVGYRPYTFFLYKQVYDNAGKPIEGLYEDKNEDGKIDDLDKYWVHNPDPNIYMGFSASATYKKFGAGFSMRASLGNYMYNNVAAGSGILVNVLTGQNYLNNGNVDILGSGFKNRQTWSDYYLQNASFLRMDNAYVNYDFGNITRKGRATLKANITVNNVFVVTKYTGLDPELSGGIDGTIYPRPRVFALGLNLGF